jgi:hypothetical protein
MNDKISKPSQARIEAMLDAFANAFTQGDGRRCRLLGGAGADRLGRR